MNKIITLIALLVVTATAYAWDIDYSKFTVRKSSVKVSELTSDYEEASDDFGTWRKSPSWWSPDQSIVLLHHIDNREDYEFYPRSGRSEIYIITPNDNAIIGGIGKDYYIPYVNKLPAFIEIYTSSDGGDYSEFSNEEHQSKQKKDSLRMFSICSGPQCNRLIKSSTIRFYTRNYNHDAQAKIGTFDYIGDCTYKTIKTGRQEQNYIVQEVTITPHIPTTQI